MYTIELNNERRDANFASGKLKNTSPVVEVFSAMVNGKDVGSVKTCTDEQRKVSEKFIKTVIGKAAAGDANAISEMNELRRFIMEPVLLKEIRLLGIYGNYRQLGFNDSCEIEIPEIINDTARFQAAGQDVKFPVIRKKRVGIQTTMISGGYAVDYRKANLGDMSDENELVEQVRIQIRNKAAYYVIQTIYDAIKNATGVKYMFEGPGLTKGGVDEVIAKVRRFGKVTISGDYALISQFNAFAGYSGLTPTVNGISEAVMNEIHNTGLMGMYNGAVLSEIPNEYDLTALTADGDNFKTMLPAGLGFVIPTGTASPIYTITRGGLTSFSGNDVTTGTLLSRFDMEVGALVAPGQEYKVALIHDTNLDDLAG